MTDACMAEAHKDWEFSIQEPHYELRASFDEARTADYNEPQEVPSFVRGTQSVELLAINLAYL